ncbi:glycoside hydrolase family 3 C-terminal domain-containing protein [Arthrobacter sp. zg-Y826]|uniref:glycoside hydrolase family 3 protein n=1 Tax=Arthrobacter jinronghuae TaxID=2964609 RepID=UPI0021030A6C|nr:glycoside hydrolase family 3 C-terminal domain-containing protein [Arthrobacter jinronghuae]MCQ1958007.1 glycoside hydrolase family 3 C-terminal domain-containing protein [Arthrobacter jinronghuae]
MKKSPALVVPALTALLRRGSPGAGSRLRAPVSDVPPPGARPRASIRRILTAAVCAAALVSPSGIAGAADGQSGRSSERSWWDEDQSATERANALLPQMSLEEKVDMLHGELNSNYGFYNAPIERLGIPALTMTDGRNGVRQANNINNNGLSTLLPSAISVAASWDRNVSERHSQVATDEAFRNGLNVLLAPSMNIARVPQNGRNFESFGEDPLLQGIMGSAYSETTQDYGGVISNQQNVAAYTQETNRLQGLNNVMDERTLQEIYTRPFAIAIEGSHPGSVMCGFNQVNGEQSCDSGYLLNEILKTQLEFEGWVLTDYGARTTTLGINNGLDQLQPGNFTPVAGEAGTCLFCQPLIDAVNAGDVPIERINDAVRRILRPMFALGLFDRSYEGLPIAFDAHNAESAELAEEGMVLLKNDDELLPFNADELDSIAVIGTDADVVVQGGGSAYIANPAEETSALQGIRNRLAGTGTEVAFVPGTDPVTSVAALPGAQPIPSSFLTPVDGTPGTGLSAQYFLNQDFSGTPYLDRVDPYAGLNAGFLTFTGLGASSPNFPAQPQALNTNMSARWTGTLTAPVTGTYELQVVTNGRTTLTVDGNQVVNETGFFTPSTEASNQTISVPLDFTAGSSHSVELSYVYDTGSEWNQSAAQIKLGWVPPEGTPLPQAVNAAAAAAEADAAVVMVRDFSSEGADLPDLALPNRQAELIRAVGAANPNTVVVMTTGAAVEVVDWQDAVDGLVQAWYPGQNQGTAIAGLLFGDTNPSGRLPITMPVSADLTPTASPAQFPGIDGVNAQFTEGIFEGYRGYRQFGLPSAYPFGFGLSYTEFDYSDLRVTCDASAPGGSKSGSSDTGSSDSGTAPEPQLSGDAAQGHGHGKDRCKGRPLEVSVRLTNTGDRTGSEVVQAYAGPLPAPVATAERSLAGWEKVTLDPGQSRRVRLPLDIQSFSYWDIATDQWVTPAGTVPVYVGSSVEDTPLTTEVRIRPLG